MTEAADPRILDLEIEKHRLECEKLRAEIEQARLPLWKRSGYVASLSPIVIALVAFLSAWITGYFDTQKKILAADVENLTEKRDALGVENAGLQKRLTELAQRRDLLEASVVARQLQIDNGYLRLKVVAGEATYALGHFRAFDIDSKLKTLITQAKSVPGNDLIVKSLGHILEEQKALRDILEISEKEFGAFGETLGTLPVSNGLKRTRHDPIFSGEALWTEDGRVYDLETRKIFTTEQEWRAARDIRSGQ